MRSSAADKALRRLVAKLAAAAPEDVDDVLAALDPAQRGVVRALLDDYATPERPAARIEPEPAPAPPAPSPVAEPPAAPTGFSPWLADRLAAAAAGNAAAAADFRMTAPALAALLESARRLPAQEADVADAAPERGGNPFRRWSRPRSPQAWG